MRHKQDNTATRLALLPAAQDALALPTTSSSLSSESSLSSTAVAMADVLRIGKPLAWKPWLCMPGLICARKKQKQAAVGVRTGTGCHHAGASRGEVQTGPPPSLKRKANLALGVCTVVAGGCRHRALGLAARHGLFQQQGPAGRRGGERLMSLKGATRGGGAAATGGLAKMQRSQTTMCARKHLQQPAPAAGDDMGGDQRPPPRHQGAASAAAASSFNISCAWDNQSRRSSVSSSSCPLPARPTPAHLFPARTRAPTATRAHHLCAYTPRGAGYGPARVPKVSGFATISLFSQLQQLSSRWLLLLLLPPRNPHGALSAWPRQGHGIRHHMGCVVICPHLSLLPHHPLSTSSFLVLVLLPTPLLLP